MVGMKKMNTANTGKAQTPSIRAVVSALIEIRKMAMEHSCFDADCFERRDIDGLCDQGGDICDWTMVAIHADDGLRADVLLSDAGGGNISTKPKAQ